MGFFDQIQLWQLILAVAIIVLVLFIGLGGNGKLTDDEIEKIIDDKLNNPDYSAIRKLMSRDKKKGDS